jgi:hypothetical protein
MCIQAVNLTVYLYSAQALQKTVNGTLSIFYGIGQVQGFRLTQHWFQYFYFYFYWNFYYISTE